MLKKIFDMFSRKKDDSIFNMSKGSTFTYKGVIWNVLEVYLYDWGEEGASKEYKIVGDGQEAFLEVENDEGEILINFSVEVNIDQLRPDMSLVDFSKEDVLENIYYSNKQYTLNEIYEGYFKNVTHYEMSQKLTNFIYKDGSHFVCIEYWADKSTEFSVGQSIVENAISNIQNSNINF